MFRETPKYPGDTLAGMVRHLTADMVGRLPAG
jgi:hypothetical protein